MRARGPRGGNCPAEARRKERGCSSGGGGGSLCGGRGERPPAPSPRRSCAAPHRPRLRRARRKSAFYARGRRLEIARPRLLERLGPARAWCTRGQEGEGRPPGAAAVAGLIEEQSGARPRSSRIIRGAAPAPASAVLAGHPSLPGPLCARFTPWMRNSPLERDFGAPEMFAAPSIRLCLNVCCLARPSPWAWKTVEICLGHR